ncbi:MAG: DUF2284 domain-containing protein [Candidatus Thermoplasmatota archaeon]|nr:DUF2284 domain-containing protein [Candidatus Thermoplasmatota archaeon]
MAKSDLRISALIKEAKRLGATDAKAISARDIFVDERVRFKCLVPLCHNYGRHLMCPPDLPSPSAFRKIVDSYHRAILVQLESDVDLADRPKGRLDGKTAGRSERTKGGNVAENRLHAIINNLEALAFGKGFYLAAGLIGSECLLCEECVGRHDPGGCRHPFKARPSMQALGIDVIKTSRKAGLPLEFSSNGSVRWTGLLLLD